MKKSIFKKKNLTQFENESEKYYKIPNNFHYEGVKWGTFGGTLGVWEVKWHLNLLTNICRHLPHQCYKRI